MHAKNSRAPTRAVNPPPRRKHRLRLFLIWLISTVAMGAGLFVEWQIDQRIAKERQEARDGALVGNVEETSRAFLENLRDGARFAAGNRLVLDWLERGDLGRPMVEALYSDFIAATPLCSQIQLVDMNGMERVRVERWGSSIQVVDAELLQDKSNEPFVKEGLAAPRETIVVSRFDLNLERGVVEMPRKPMLRIATAVVDRHGKRRGDVILSYLGKPLLERIANTASNFGRQLEMLNGAGYWLLGADADANFSFMFDGKRSLAAEQPEFWRLLGESPRRQLIEGDNLVTYASVDPQAIMSGSATSAARDDRIWKFVVRGGWMQRAGVFTPIGIVLTTFFWLALLHTEWQLVVTWRRHAEARDKLAASYEEMEAAKEAAESASRTKSSFLANMSHELRTPLNAIIGYSELVREDLDDEDLRHDLDNVLKAAKHLLGLINDVLDLSKIEADRMELLEEDVTLRMLFEDTRAAVMPLAKAKSNQFEVDLVDDCVVHADAVRLKQVLINLLGNAFKFTEHGTVTLRGCMAMRDGVPAAVISVHDTGIGMTEAQLAKVFEEFVQADPAISKKYGGTGLGLALSRRLVEMMQGRIECESEHGKGSTFSIVLPLAERPTVDAPEAISPADAVKPRATVLIIDDDPQNLDILTRRFSDAGFNVLCACDGIPGLEIALRELPDVIVLDVVMPRLDGWGTLTALKQEPATADIPVILYTVVNERHRGIALGAADYIVKPLDAGALIEAVAKHLPPSSPQPLVLVVDDDEVVRRTVARALSKKGIHVEEAQDGAEAIAKLDHNCPQLVLTDLWMPRLDGFALLEAMHSCEAWRDIPVVVMTAHTLSPDERERLHFLAEATTTKGETELGELVAKVFEEMSPAAVQGDGANS